MKYPVHTKPRGMVVGPGLSGPNSPVSAMSPDEFRDYLRGDAKRKRDNALINAAEEATRRRKAREAEWQRRRFKPPAFGKRAPFWPAKKLGRVPWLDAAEYLWYMLNTPAIDWVDGDRYGPWELYRTCFPPNHGIQPVAHRMYNLATLGIENCYVLQAGFWDGVTINPGPPWTESTPGSLAASRNRWVHVFKPSLAIPGRVSTFQIWKRMHTADTPGFAGPNSMTPQPPRYKDPGQLAPQGLPGTFDAPWWAQWNPDAYPPGSVPFEQSPPPIKDRPGRPAPWSSQAPDVGPRPQPAPWEYPESYPGPQPQPGTWPSPQPNPAPGPIPVPDDLPEAFPEVQFQPVPSAGSQAVTGSAVRREPPGRDLPTNAGNRTKETKAKASRTFGFLWNAIGGVTEGIDFVEVLYECLPRADKISNYQSRGRQPNPGEKAEIIYQLINKLDVGCALTGYVENQLEDMLYALGGKQLGQAARDRNRPIGYEAGGSLTGGGPFVGINIF